MAVTDYPTQLPIATWARIMGLNPLHFHGITIPNLQQQTCGAGWSKYDWQNSDAISRQQIAEKIAEAEYLIEAFLGYHLTPRWDSNRRINIVRPAMADSTWFRSYDARGFPHSILLPWGKFRAGGVRAVSAIQAGAAISWSVADSFGWKAIGTVTVLTTATDMNEIHVYFPGMSPDTENEIRPITATNNGGTVTITFARELCVKPELENGLVNYSALDGTDDSNFISTVDVYRVYNNSGNHGISVWENINGSCGCSSSNVGATTVNEQLQELLSINTQILNILQQLGGYPLTQLPSLDVSSVIDASGLCTVCQYAYQNLCLTARNYEMGQVVFHPAEWSGSQWNQVDWVFGRIPDMIYPSYYSGADSMDIITQQSVAYLAASKLDRPPCDCAATTFENLQADLAYQSGAKELASYRVLEAELGNPFGTERGALMAWRRILKLPQLSNGRAGVVLA